MTSFNYSFKKTTLGKKVWDQVFAIFKEKKVPQGCDFAKEKLVFLWRLGSTRGKRMACQAGTTQTINFQVTIVSGCAIPETPLSIPKTKLILHNRDLGE